MKDFDKIYLSWRKGQGYERFIVGVLQRDMQDRFIFQYFKTEVDKAKESGFSPYTEFSDVSKIYTSNVLEIFGQRIIKSERPDVQDFYDFWEIEPQYKDDKFYLLGHTQGLLPTDNFEFLAEYKISPTLHFLTELAGLSQYKLLPGEVKVGDVLTFKLDNENKFDGNAVKVICGAKEIGFIKKIHCSVFHQDKSHELKLTVKAFDKNGLIKRVFIKVSM